MELRGLNQPFGWTWRCYNIAPTACRMPKLVMPDLSLDALDTRQRKLVYNTKRAFETGDLDYVITVCDQVLQSAPGCLPVRRIQRSAQLRKFSKHGGWMGKALSGFTALLFVLCASRKNPAESLAQANKILNKDPHSITGLQLLAEAATINAWPETAAFALGAIFEIEPTDRKNLLALGEAWLAAQKPDAALRVADELLKLNPVDGEAQKLMRKASITSTTVKGQWESGGNFREKISGEAGAPLPGRADQPKVTGDRPLSDAKSTNASNVDPLVAARDLVERYPDDLDARFGLAELLIAAGEIESAIAQYQQSQKSPKLRSRSLLGLARCFRDRGLHDLAIALLSNAKNEHGTHDELKKEIVYELGICFEQSNQPQLAMAEFKEIYAEDIGFRDVAAKINAHYAPPSKEKETER